MNRFSDRFSQCAFSAIVSDAAFVVIAGVTLMFAFSFNPALALNIGGGIALIFSLRLIHQLSKLQKEGICQTDVWQFMEPNELPHDAFGIRRAQDQLENLLLRFAKGASAVSIAMFVAALLITLN